LLVGIKMNSNLKNYILAEARTDWIIELMDSPEDEQRLCEFVKRITLEALWFPEISRLFLDSA
jgi:hypothetical protein